MNYLHGFPMKLEEEKKIKEVIDAHIKNHLLLQPLFYNLKTVESLLGISKIALKNRIRRGTIKAVKDGNIILIPKKEVQRLINALNFQLSQSK